MGVSENLGTKMRNGDDDKPLDFGGTFPIGLFFLANQKKACSNRLSMGI